MKPFSPSGVYSAMITPYDSDGNVDLNAAGKLVDFLAEHKADGVFPSSNVGEFARLSVDERIALIKEACQTAGGRIRVTPGVTDLTIKNVIKLCEESAKAGADAVVLSAPYYYRHSEHYIRAHFMTAAEESPIPVCVYNSPGFVNPIPEDMLIEILAHPNVVAVKESSGNLKFFAGLSERLSREHIDVSLMIGWEEMLLPALSLGASGCVVTCGGVIPEVLSAIIDAFSHGDMILARELQFRVTRLMREIMLFSFPEGCKLAVRSRTGIPFSILRDSALGGYEDELLCNEERMSMLIGTLLEGI